MEQKPVISQPIRDIDIDSERLLIQQAQWVFERLEGINQGLMGRAVSLVGFAGIELSLVGQMVINLRKSVSKKNWSLHSQIPLFVLESITVLALLTCIGFLFWSFRPRKKPFVPGIEDMIQRLDDIDKAEVNERQDLFMRRSFPLHQLLMRGVEGPTYSKYLNEENKHRGKFFALGFNTLVGAQFGLGILVLFAYWR